MHFIHNRFFILSCTLWCLIPLMGFKLHPFHVSSTEVLYGNQKTIEVSTRIFTDDFELQLSKIFKVKIDLSNPKMHKSMDALVEKYIHSVLQIQSGNQAVPLQYLGYEINREATQIYLESNAVTVPKQLQINNKIMFQLFDDQNNIVHVIINGKRKSEQMPYPTSSLNFTF